METHEIILIVSVVLLSIAVLILIPLTIYYAMKGGMCDGTYDDSDAPYINPDYTYYWDGTNCQKLSDSSNWVDFELTNNSNTSFIIQSTKTLKSSCSDSYSYYNIFNWNIPASAKKYNSKCIQGGPLGYLTMFKDMFIMVRNSSDPIPVSYNGVTTDNAEVQLKNVDPEKQKFSVVISGNSSSTYLATINVKNK